MINLKFIEEPKLEFALSQFEEHPKDGLFLYGPAASDAKGGLLKFGVIGTPEGHKRFEAWASVVRGYIPPYKEGVPHHAAFPGFEAAFNMRWPDKPLAQLILDPIEISKRINKSNRPEAVKDTVDLYADAIEQHLQNDAEVTPDFWYVVIPDEVYRFGRPQMVPPKSQQTESRAQLTHRAAKKLQAQISMFDEDNEQVSLLNYAVNFHNQLKARLLKTAVVQIVKESMLYEAADVRHEILRRSNQDAASIAWNLCTTSYYKSAGPPWRLRDVRKGVCYVGIVFKQDASSAESDKACCGAQLFLRSGEGLVFKGTTGAWYSKKLKEFHLPQEQASKLMNLVVSGYRSINGNDPEEIFIHAKSRFNQNEWAGFESALPEQTKLTGIRIRSNDTLKLYRLAKQPPVRGVYHEVHPRMAYLWTKGYISRYDTYPGFEVPNPLSVNIDWGEADIGTVVSDILALTKVNFNACNFSDGLPVTLKFADAIGDILTATPDVEDGAPQLFKYYI